MFKLKLGISTACLYPEPTEISLQKLVDYKVKNTEIFLNTFSELEQTFIQEIKLILKNSETSVISVHPFTSGMELMLFFSKYERRLEDGFDLYKKYFNFCNEVGAKYLVFHGAYKGLELDNDFYFERFSRLNEVAKAMGVEVLQENVARCKSGHLEFVKEMKRVLGDSVHFVLDTKQCIRSDTNPIEMLNAMGSNLRHVHISDSDSSDDCLPPGKGNNLELFIELLIKQKYEGAVLIEIYRQNFKRFFELIDSLKWLNNQILHAK